MLGMGSVGGLKASSVICQAGPTVPTLVTTTCGQTFVANELMNWGAPVANGGLGEALSPPGNPTLNQPVYVTAASPGGFIAADQIGITSNMLIERTDNTVYAWDSAADGGQGAWLAPSFFAAPPNESFNTFGGHFNAPSFEQSTLPFGPNNYPYEYGDPLLGTLAPSGPSVGNASMTMTFSQALYGLSFEVSNRSGVNSDFIATLNAYDSSGVLIGVYELNTNGTGIGGMCPGLTDPAADPTSIDPVPCNNAPVIQFYDPEGRIKSVVLTVNDTSGLFIDAMSMDVAAPDPGTAPLIGIGLIVLALAAKRASHWRQAKNGS